MANLFLYNPPLQKIFPKVVKTSAALPSVSQCGGSRPRVLGMAELTVGRRVRIRPSVGQVQEGVVYTHDVITNTITIKQEIPNTKTHSAVLVFNRAHIEIDVVPGADVVDDYVTLPNIR